MSTSEMTDREILEAVERAKREFGPKCSKYSGALTVALIRRALEGAGLLVSSRDVFIAGVPLEIDILIPRGDARPHQDLVYRPTEVLATVEVKNSGSFGEGTIQKIRKDFGLIRGANPRILCCYLTLAERKRFKWAITDANSGGIAYTMFWHSGSGKSLTYASTGDWDRFVTDMRRIQSA